METFKRVSKDIEIPSLGTDCIRSLVETLPPVTAVYPSGEEIPENLLRFSIVFAAPTNETVFSKIELQRSDGVRIEDPFLNQELWAPDLRRVTFLLHPGRIKSGLKANQSLGRAFETGNTVHLNIEGKRVKSWKVGSLKLDTIQPMRWHISSLKRYTCSPLKITFDTPIDAGAQELLAVVDSQNRKVAGKSELGIGEKQWTFTPEESWKNEEYHIVIHPLLEDTAGNTVNNPFEHSLIEKLERKNLIFLSLVFNM